MCQGLIFCHCINFCRSACGKLQRKLLYQLQWKWFTLQHQWSSLYCRAALQPLDKFSHSSDEYCLSTGDLQPYTNKPGHQLARVLPSNGQSTWSFTLSKAPSYSECTSLSEWIMRQWGGKCHFSLLIIFYCKSQLELASYPESKLHDIVILLL